MKKQNCTKVLAVLLTVAMLAGSFGAFVTVSAETTVTTPTSKIDGLLNGYGFEDVTSNMGGNEATRGKLYTGMGTYWESLANINIKMFDSTTENGVTTITRNDSGKDAKLYLTSKIGLKSIYDSTNLNYEKFADSRHITDMLISDTGYSKYTLEMDMAINNPDFAGTNDANNYDFSPYRGFSVLYLFSSGYAIKATGVGVGTSITYDPNVKYAESDTSDTYVESTSGSFYNVTAAAPVDKSTKTGYLYLPSQASSYIVSDENLAGAASSMGTKCTSQKDTTFDTTGAIDFNKITTLVPYTVGVEQKLVLVFERVYVKGPNNDKFNVTISYGGKELGTVSYTNSYAARKNGISFCDHASPQLTLDNFKLTVDTTSQFYACNHGNTDGASYWRSTIENTDNYNVKTINNTSNGFNVLTSCALCGEESNYMYVDKIIENNIPDVAYENYAYEIIDRQNIVKGTKDYWFAADINTAADFTAPTSETPILTIGDSNVLKVGTDGSLKFGSGTATGVTLSTKNSYAVAVNVIPADGKYELYIDNKLIGSEDITVSNNIIRPRSLETLRILNIKAVTLTSVKPLSHVKLTSSKDPGATYCATHTEASDSVRTFHKFPVLLNYANNVLDMTYSYPCSTCGQRVYVETGDNLVTSLISENNFADSYSVVQNSINGSDGLFSVDLKTDSTKAGAPNYWISFDYTSVDLAPEKLVSFKGGGNGNLLNSMQNYTSFLRFFTIADTTGKGYQNTDEIMAAINDGTLETNLTTGYDSNYMLLCHQNGKNITIVESGKTYSISILVHPHYTSSGYLDIYLDGKYIGRSTGKTYGENKKTDQLRVGTYGKAVYSNLSVVEAAHTCTDEYSETYFDQNYAYLNYRYTCCSTTYDNTINAALLNGTHNVNDGFDTLTYTPTDDYWIATDINVRDTLSDGALLTLGSDKLLEISGGKLKSSGTSITTVAAPTTYSVAARIKGSSFDLYVEDELVKSGTLSASGATELTLGSEGFGYDLRFNHNIIVTLGTGNNDGVGLSFYKDNEGQLCYHYGAAKNNIENFSTRLVSEAENGGNPDTDNRINLLCATYICGDCGERVYNGELGRNLYNVAPVEYNSDGSEKTVNKYNTLVNNGRIELTESQWLFTNKEISAGDKPYWLSFKLFTQSLSPKAVAENTNSGAQGEANFFNVMTDYQSAMRLYTVPSYVDEGTPLSSLKTTGTHFKVTTDYSNKFLLLRNKSTGENIGLIKQGEIYDVAIRIDPKGNTQIYFDGKLVSYQGSDCGSTGAASSYALRFMDVDSGNFELIDFAFVEEDAPSVNFGHTGVVEAEITHTAVENATTYTSLLSARGIGLLSVEDATGKLVVPGGDGSYTKLYDKLGNEITVGETATKVAIVNDYTKFTYFVNGSLAYTAAPVEGEEPAYATNINLASIADFAKMRLAKGVTVTGNYGTSARSADFIGVQKRAENEVFQNEIRIVAGLDSLYFGGVEFEVYNETTFKSVEVPVCTTVYESLLSDNEKVYATDYGYTYFAIFEINGIDMSLDASYKVRISPKTTCGNLIQYGESATLTITVDATAGTFTVTQE